MDSSASIVGHYQDEKNFVKSLALKLKEGGSQAGVITFSTDSEIFIKLNQYHTTESFDKVSLCDCEWVCV